MPTRFGDEVAIESTPTRVGRSSLDVRHRLTKNGELAVEGFETRVWVQGRAASTGMKAVPMPPALVERLLHG
jgi:4-hydroxybenzoyl-CoA thioesterase